MWSQQALNKLRWKQQAEQRRQELHAKINKTVSAFKKFNVTQEQIEEAFTNFTRIVDDEIIIKELRSVWSTMNYITNSEGEADWNKVIELHKDSIYQAVNYEYLEIAKRFGIKG